VSIDNHGHNDIVVILTNPSEQFPVISAIAGTEDVAV
jgi:hypothetical protein